MVLADRNIRFGRVKKWSTQDFEISVEGKQLTIFYTPKTSRTFYNVADTSGNVIVTGSVSETGITSCVLHFALAGNYSLTLIDGEDMLTQPIKLS
ncbi:MAG: hypothetical protein JKY53_02655 [Flavobacteriales bacterium]|nr:hypothetical protein [Flavobacteriales bacterium]